MEEKYYNITKIVHNEELDDLNKKIAFKSVLVGLESITIGCYISLIFMNIIADNNLAPITEWSAIILCNSILEVIHSHDLFKAILNRIKLYRDFEELNQNYDLDDRGMIR